FFANTAHYKVIEWRPPRFEASPPIGLSGLLTEGDIPIEIGESGGRLEGKDPMPIIAYCFPGETDKHARVVSGIHGSGLSGIEVAYWLIVKLRDRIEKEKIRPRLTTYIIPELFPESAIIARDSGGQYNVGREVEVPMKNDKKRKKKVPP